MQQLTLGNTGNTRVEQTCFNARLQPVGIRLGSAATTNCANSGDLLNLAYTYSSSYNNGNVQNQTITRGAQTWADGYGYDGVNRLTSAVESGSGNWSQSYTYSASGNRAVSGGYVPNPGWTPQTLLAYNSYNQWTGTGVSYDGAGNQIGLPSESFTYDAEGRLNTATVFNMPPISYSYDGDGRRVTKTVGAALTVYVYDAAGQLALEYDTTAPNATGTTYLTGDHLGSTRLLTSGSTWAQSQCFDYLPFGEEIAAGMFGRPSCFSSGTYPINPSPDVTAEKFTGEERNPETGLDWFESRYFSGPQGRFTSPDNPPAGSDPSNPQNWNLLSYGLNNPLRYSDPDGHDPCENGVNPETGNICTVGTAQAPEEETTPWPLLDVLIASMQVVQQTQQVLQPVVDWFSRPPNPLCVAGYTAVGASIGFWAGGGLGALGLAGGPAAALTIPGGAAGGLALGGGIGGLGGTILCRSGTGPGGGSGGGGGQPASEKTAQDMAKQIERDLGKDARRAFHDAKHGGIGDRTLAELKADAKGTLRGIRKDTAQMDAVNTRGEKNE